jgi:hypothetical protein
MDSVSKFNSDSFSLYLIIFIRRFVEIVSISKYQSGRSDSRNFNQNWKLSTSGSV